MAALTAATLTQQPGSIQPASAPPNPSLFAIFLEEEDSEIAKKAKSTHLWVTSRTSYFIQSLTKTIKYGCTVRGLWTAVLKPRVWILAVTILAFLEPEVTIFGRE